MSSPLIAALPSRSLLTAIALCVAGFGADLAAQQLTLVDEDGAPVVGATVELLAAEADSLVGPIAVSDLEGRVEIAPDTRYPVRLRVRYVGYRPVVRRVAAPEMVPARLALEPDVRTLATAQVVAVRARPSDPFAFVDVKPAELVGVETGQDVPTLLRRTPGAVVTSDAGTGIGYSGIRVRGADATRINVTVNGVPLNDAESQGVYWVNMPDFISSTSSVQVQRGVGESTYGAGAFGANINLVTEAPTAQPGLSASVSGGSFATGRAKLEVNTGELGRGLSANARVSYITSDGFVDRAASRLGSAYLATSWAASDRERLQLIGWTGKERTYQSWYGIPRGFAEDDDLRTYNPAGLRDDGTFYADQVDNYRQTHAQALYSRQLRGDALLQLTGHYTRGRGYYEEWRNGNLLADYFPHGGEDGLRTDLVRRLWLDNHFFGAIATVSGRLSPKLDLTWSGGASRYLGDHFGTVPFLAEAVPGVGEPGERRFYDNTGTKTDANTFAKVNYALTERLSLYADAQVRHLRYDFVGVDRSGATLPDRATFTFFNPKAGLSLRDARGGQLFASAAVAQREPNRNDFVSAPAGQRPSAERLYDFELGYRIGPAHTRGRLDLEANAYYMRYVDQLVATGELNDVGELVRANVDDSYRLGVELAAAYRLTERWAVDGNLALSRNRIGRFEEFLDNWTTGAQDAVTREGTPIAFSPGVIANAGVMYGIGRGPVGQRPLEVALWYKHVGAQYLDNSGRDNARLEDYGRLDLEAAYTLRPRGGRSVTFTLQLNNLLDANPLTNGWSYRFRSPGYDPRPDDPYASLDRGDTYALTGYYPQAGFHVLGGVRLDLGAASTRR